MPEKNKSDNTSSGKRKRLVLYLLLGLFSILVITVTYLVYFSEDLAKNLLMEQLNEQLAPHAEIEIDEFIFSILPAAITLEGVRIVHNTPFEEIEPIRKTDSIRKFSFSKASVEGFDLLRLVFRKQWHLQSFSVDGLQIDVVPFPDESDNEADVPAYTFPLHISEVEIENSHFTSYRDRDGNLDIYSIKNLSGKVSRFTFSEPAAALHTYFDEIALRADSLSYKTTDGLYQILIHSFDADTETESVTFEKAEIVPSKSATEMAAASGEQTDQYNLETGAFKAAGFQSKKWLRDNEINITSVVIDSPNLIINRDKTYPRPDRDSRPLPQQQFIDLPFSVKIDTIQLDSGSIRYIEKFPQQGREGEISFHNMNVLVEDLQNKSREDSVRVHASANFLNEVPIEVYYLFSIRDNAGHSISGSMGGFQLNLINPIIENLTAKHIRQGTLDDFRFNFHANEYASTGSLYMIYNDLELRFLDEESLEETRSRRLRSFFANRLRIRAGNDANDPRDGTIDFERDTERSIFNYWWKSLLSGIEDVIIR